MGGNGMAVWPLRFRWPYILIQAKERRRRSTITHKRKSSFLSPPKKGVEITSAGTKRTHVICDDFMLHSLQKLSPGSAGSAFQWSSEDQALHSPWYESWLGLDRTRAPYSAPGTRFSALTEHFRDSVINSWDEICETGKSIKAHRETLKPGHSCWVSVQERRLSKLTLFPWPRV